MNWSDVLNDPSLQNLPYKIELNERGQIVMSPASNKHGFLQVLIAIQLNSLVSSGHVLSECSIASPKGVKVADVVWGSQDFFDAQAFNTPLNQAPELCVEVVSPGNSYVEMAEKQRLYLQQGAKEVWFCSLSGDVTFFDVEGELERSMLFPNFPLKLYLPY